MTTFRDFIIKKNILSEADNVLKIMSIDTLYELYILFKEFDALQEMEHNNELVKQATKYFNDNK